MSLFLWQDTALQNFAQAYAAQPREPFSPFLPQKTWLVVCERKEDITPVQKQLFFEINRLRKNTTANEAIVGINLMSLDDLAGLLCRALSLPHYLTLPEQEHAIEFCLQIFGYYGQDAAALSKQILALLNVDFPRDTSLFDVFKQALESSSHHAHLHELEEPTLKQIFAAYHAMREIFSDFSSFVNFTKKFQKESLAKFRVKSASCNIDFLESFVLWIGSLNYTEDPASKEPHFWGSPFPRHIIQQFKETFQEICMQCQAKPLENWWFESHVVISPIIHDPFSLELTIFQDLNEFERSTRSLEQIFSTNCVLVGDLDEDIFKPLRHDAGGVYTFKNVPEAEILSLLNGTLSKITNDHVHFKEIYIEILKLWEKFLDSFAFIKDFKIFEQAARIYELPQQTFSEPYLQNVFIHTLQSKTWHYGPQHPIFQFPRALNRLAFAGVPEKLCLIGKPHRAVASSFVVKRLTDLFYTLKRLGIEVETPKPTRTYELFWEQITQIPLRIWLPSAEEQALLSPRFAPEKAKRIDFILPKSTPNFLTSLGHFYQEKNSLHVPDWSKTLGQNKINIAVTAFETFVRCPTQFYFTHVLQQKQEKEILSVFDLNALDLGTKIHLILEQFLTRCLIEFKEDYFNQTKIFYDKILTCLLNNEPFQFLPQGFEEFYTQVWQYFSHQTGFMEVYQREALKRSLIRFFQSEKNYLQTPGLQEVGVVREWPLSFQWNGVTFYGKVDRVDRYSQPAKDGVHIIDYKTSAYPQSKEALALFPQEISAKTHLSVQGALYSYGWSQTGSDEDGVVNFSLYFLKGLDPDIPTHLTYHFPEPILPESRSQKSIEKSYEPYVQKLKAGDFSPNPLQGSQTCQWCTYRNICPQVSP